MLGSIGQVAELNRVVVVGGGVGGLTSALALLRAGVDVEVHEKFPRIQERATGFTLWSFAIKELLELGLDDPERIGQPIEFTEIHNQDGKLIEQMPVGEVSRRLGAPSCDVRRPDMQRALIELIGADRVKMGSEVVGVEQRDGSAEVLLADGGRSAGDLVIACDGVHSVVRDHVAADPQLRYSGYASWGGILDGFEHELFGPNRHIEIWARGSKGGVADVGGGRARWYVVHKAAAVVAAVGEQHLRAAVALLHTHDLGAHLHALRADQIDQRPLHVRAAHVTARRSQLARHLTDRHLLDQLAVLVVDLGELDRLADPLRVVQSQAEQLLDRKRPQGEAGCPLLDVRELLVHLDLDTRAGQRQGARQPTDSASYDHHSVQLCHLADATQGSGAPRPRRA